MNTLFARTLALSLALSLNSGVALAQMRPTANPQSPAAMAPCVMQTQQTGFNPRTQRGNEVKFWSYLLGWGPWAHRKVPEEQQQALGLGQRIHTWPDGTKAVVNEQPVVVAGGEPAWMVASNGGMTQPVSEIPPAQPMIPCPGQSLSSPNQPQPVSTGAWGTSTAPCPYPADGKAQSSQAPQGWASPPTPNAIYVDEYGRRVTVNQSGEISAPRRDLTAASQQTTTELMPVSGQPPQTMTYQQKQPNVFQRFYNRMPWVKKQPAGVSGCPVSPGQPVSMAPATGAAMFTANDRQIISQYLSEQIQTAGMTPTQFAQLPPLSQQQVLAGQSGLSPVAAGAGGLPPAVESSLQPNAVVPIAVLSQYGVPLPPPLESRLSPLPVGYQRIMMGNDAYILSSENQIVHKLSNVI